MDLHGFSEKLDFCSNGIWDLVYFEEELTYLELIKAYSKFGTGRKAGHGNPRTFEFYKPGPDVMVDMEVFEDAVSYVKYNLSSGDHSGKTYTSDYFMNFFASKGIHRLDYCPYFNSFVVGVRSIISN